MGYRIDTLLGAIKFSVPTLLSWASGVLLIGVLFNQLGLASKFQTLQTLVSEVFHVVFFS